MGKQDSVTEAFKSRCTQRSNKSKLAKCLHFPTSLKDPQGIWGRPALQHGMAQNLQGLSFCLRQESLSKELERCKSGKTVRLNNLPPRLSLREFKASPCPPHSQHLKMPNTKLAKAKTQQSSFFEGPNLCSGSQKASSVPKCTRFLCSHWKKSEKPMPRV